VFTSEREKLQNDFSHGPLRDRKDTIVKTFRSENHIFSYAIYSVPAPSIFTRHIRIQLIPLHGLGSFNRAIMFSRILFLTVILGTKLITAADLDYCPTSRPAALFVTENEATCPSMTDVAARSKSHPWTHKVRCMETPDDEYGKPQTFCLYTRAASGSRRECSIITTPALAEKLALDERTGEEKQSAGKTTEGLNSTLPAFEIRAIKGRGVGTFATSNIEVGQVIFTDSPIFITLRDALDLLPRTERQEMQWRGVLQLSVDGRRVFRNLSKSRDGDEIDDILQTNALGLSLGGQNGYLALMPQVAVSMNFLQ
jgi:hypothetical protein